MGYTLAFHSQSLGKCKSPGYRAVVVPESTRAYMKSRECIICIYTKPTTYINPNYFHTPCSCQSNEVLDRVGDRHSSDCREKRWRGRKRNAKSTNRCKQTILPYPYIGYLIRQSSQKRETVTLSERIHINRRGNKLTTPRRMQETLHERCFDHRWAQS